MVHFDRLKPCARRADQEKLEQQPVPVQTDPQDTSRLDDEEENWIDVSTQEDNAEREQPAPLDEEQGEGDPQRDQQEQQQVEQLQLLQRSARSRRKPDRCGNNIYD